MSVDKATEELSCVGGRKTIAGTDGITHGTQLIRGQAKAIFVTPIQESSSRADGAGRGKSWKGTVNLL